MAAAGDLALAGAVLAGAALAGAALAGVGTFTTDAQPGHFTLRPAADAGAVNVLPHEHRTGMVMEECVPKEPTWNRLKHNAIHTDERSA